MSAQRNSMWQASVRALLRDGLGVEDIAIRTNATSDDVRREVEILRASGELTEIFRL